MKKEYMKPAMRVVKIQKRVHLLAGSPNSVPMYSGDGNQITNEEFVW